MSQRKQYTGYVLHKRAYRETSLLVDFFTLEQGKVGAVAKGARGNAKSDRKSLLQPLQKIEFELSGRSNLKNLGRLEASSASVRLSQNALYCAFYINEILSRALPEAEPISDLFHHYEQTLNQLLDVKSNSLSDFEPILREFEFTLLLTLGYLPDFAYAMDTGNPIDATLSYVFDPQGGFLQTHPGMINAISGACLIAIAKGDYQHEQNLEFATQARKAAKQICRMALKEVIGDKPIKSRELFLPS